MTETKEPSKEAMAFIESCSVDSYDSGPQAMYGDGDLALDGELVNAVLQHVPRSTWEAHTGDPFEALARIYNRAKGGPQAAEPPEPRREAAWASALQHLRGSGADVEAMLKAATENIVKYSSDKLQFPVVFPQDDPEPRPIVVAPREVFVSVYPSGNPDNVGVTATDFEVLPGLSVHRYVLSDPEPATPAPMSTAQKRAYESAGYDAGVLDEGGHPVRLQKPTPAPELPRKVEHCDCDPCRQYNARLAADAPDKP